MSQKVLVAGTGISGISAAKLLLAQGGEVVLYDGNEKLSEEKLKAKFDEGAKVTIVLGELKKTDLMGVELCVISPGIPLEAPFVAVIDEAKIRSGVRSSLLTTAQRENLRLSQVQTERQQRQPSQARS